MNDNEQIANQFIDLWQENFEKILSGDENMRQMQHMFESMKGFYAPNAPKDAYKDESSPAADSNAYGDGDASQLISSLERKLAELEGRVAKLEKP